VIPLAEAREFVLGSCRALPARSTALDDALGCVSASSVVASEPVPPFVNSSMDGYAVRSADLVAASPGEPVRLEVVGTVLAGSVEHPVVGAGQAVRIMTGAPLPPGADAVCMLEVCATESGASVVVIDRAVDAGTFVRTVGQDVAVGDTVVGVGTVLTPAHLGSLANQGAAEVVVHPRPRIGILSTGNELVEAGLPLHPGGIRDANRHSLLALVRQEGWEPVDLGIVGDDEADVAAGSISWASPLAKATLGARVGDTVKWRRPAGASDVEIVSIDYAAAPRAS